MSTDMLFLNETDTITCGVLDPQFCIENAAEVFRLLEAKDYMFGGKSGLDHGHTFMMPASSPIPGFPVKAPGYSFMAMLGYVGGRFNAIGEKWYGRNPKNIQKGMPRANHMVILNDIETGAPYVFIVANLLSAMRSSAVPALAMREMSSEKSEVVGLLGAGLLNRATLPCIKAVRPNIKEVKVHDILPERSEAFCKDLSQQLGIDVHPVADTEAAVRGSDIIHTATAGKISPYIKREWLKDNVLLAVNSSLPFDDEIFDISNITIDLYESHIAWQNDDPGMGLTSYRVIDRVNAGKTKREEVLDLGAILSGKADGALKKDRPTIFIFHGMPPLDIALGKDIYDRAIEKGVGTKLTLWDTPYWY